MTRPDQRPIRRLEVDRTTGVEEEIAVLHLCLDDCKTVIHYDSKYPHVGEACASVERWTKRKGALGRTLIARQAALAELKRGMQSQRKSATEKEKR